MEKCVFLDRDGVINEMVYMPEHGYVDSPSNVKQFVIIKGVLKALKILKKLGYKIIIISNQPGIAKGYYNKKTFSDIKENMNKNLLKAGIVLDGEYYCLHHPNAKLHAYKKKCSCRKPEIGLIKKAIKEHDIDKSKSFFIGDGITDIQAATKINCKSIFIGNVNSAVNELLTKKKLYPNYIASNLLEAVNIIQENSWYNYEFFLQNS